MPPEYGRLHRELGVFGATMMGLGSIIGTGVFVSIGVAAGIAGPAVVVAIALAALVATCNALNSAQLAASHPVSGGTYEYGYKYLNSWLGFTAGWTFLCAKSASAATAALGFAGYVLTPFRGAGESGRVSVGAAAVVILTVLVLSGIRRSSHVNIAVVSISTLSLVFFCLAGIPSAIDVEPEHFSPFLQSPAGEQGTPAELLLHATALMFVAFTGYGRIATLGEEVQEPQRTIPRAIVLTLLVSGVLYAGVGLVGIASAGAEGMWAATRSQAAPLAVIARRFGVPGAEWIVAAGAVTAMLGVLLNLILGLSRVVLAMARRGDLPGALALLDRWGRTPWTAVLLVATLIGGLTLVGSVRTTWTFSAFTVLIYYAITNLAALRLPAGQRLYSRAWAYGGLAACLVLAFQVEREIWLAGLGLIAAGLIWHAVARRRTAHANSA